MYFCDLERTSLFPLLLRLSRLSQFFLRSSFPGRPRQSQRRRKSSERSFQGPW